MSKAKANANDTNLFQVQLQGQAEIRIATTAKIVGRNSKYWGLQNCL